jgi:ABC-type sugar transport system permease subunit
MVMTHATPAPADPAGVAPTPASGSEPDAGGGRRRRGRAPGHSARIGLAFVAPFLAFLIVFQYVPIALLIRNSLFDYTLINPALEKFVGFDQYAELVTDGSTAGSFLASFVFALGVVVLVIPLGFLLALFLNGRFAGRSLVRTIVFLPVVTSIVVTSTMWLFMLTKNGGLINSALTGVGLPQVEFLTTIPFAMISIIVMTAWQQVGFAAVLFLTGLQAVPTDVIEAARVDGASPARIVTAIIMPLMSRTTLFVVIAMTVFALQAFAPAFLMTSGGPQESTNLIVYAIFNAAFKLQDPGFASAMAVALMLLALVLSGIQSLFLRSKWSY